LFVTLATAPARPDRPNEDFVVASPDVVVLLDGVSVPDGVDTGCTHGVAWFAGTLGHELLGQARNPDLSLHDALSRSLGHVRSLHADTCDLDNPASPAATVVIVNVAGPALRYLVLADSVLMLDRGGAAPEVITDERLAAIVKRHPAKVDHLDVGSAEYRAALREHSATLTRHRNVPGGFWTASTDPGVAVEALTGSVPLHDLRSATLLTDGATRLVDLYGLATWADLHTLIIDAGPHELIRRVREAEASDPAGVRWSRRKIHDDATVAHCRFDTP
jgi:hypothetical protein